MKMVKHLRSLSLSATLGFIFSSYRGSTVSGFVVPSTSTLQKSYTAFTTTLHDNSRTSAVDVIKKETSDSLKRQELKEEIYELSKSTSRGFDSTFAQKKQAKELANSLSEINPTKEPAFPYYETPEKDYKEPNLSGKWTLIYTDAPDITSLGATSPIGFSTATLGRIGQECNPPFIKNVIEWKKPDWISSLPLIGGSTPKNTRILQKVVCKGKASPNEPMGVNLDIVGLELLGDSSNSNNSSSENIISQLDPANILKEGVELKGPLTAPFGKFTILYLDEELRVIRTNQGYLAINRREEEWF